MKQPVNIEKVEKSQLDIFLMIMQNVPFHHYLYVFGYFIPQYKEQFCSEF